MIPAAHELPLTRGGGGDDADGGGCGLDAELFGKLALTDQVDELIAAGEMVVTSQAIKESTIALSF